MFKFLKQVGDYAKETVKAAYYKRASAFEPKFVGETQDFGPECFALHRESRQTLE
jgi:hypothetical protein